MAFSRHEIAHNTQSKVNASKFKVEIFTGVNFPSFKCFIHKATTVCEVNYEAAEVALLALEGIAEM